MPLTTDFNADPYYDDYDQDKGFYRILFRPGFAVQAREVTQLQTILQKQVERHGEHMFQDGSIVLGCDLNYDNEIKSIQLETQFGGADITIGDFANGVVTGGTSNARAVVVATAAATTADQPVILINYLSNDTFSDGETITVEGSTTQANTVSAAGAAGIDTGAQSNASVVSCQSGVFYVGGYFVFKAAESLILEKFSSEPSYRIGFDVTESIVTADSDTTLLDPAQGAYNYAATGANRFKIVLSLSAKTFSASDSVEAAADENFYQLLKIESGKKVEETNYPVYSELEKTLARRTFDESGDYTITPFNLQLATHQGITGTTGNSGTSTSTLTGNGTNFTTDISAGDVVFLSGNTAQTATIASVTNSTVATLNNFSGGTGTLITGTSGQTIKFESKFSAGLDPGKAYVKGYEYESISTKFVTVDKGRDTLTVNAYGLNTSFGNKLNIKIANGYFDLARHQIVSLYVGNVASQNVSGDGTSDSLYGTTFLTRNSQTKIGTARVRDIDFRAASGNTSNVTHSQSDYVIYLYDVRTANAKTGTVADVPRLTGGIGNNSLKAFMPFAPGTRDETSKTFEPRRDVVTIGTRTFGNVSSTNYLTGGGSTNTSFAKIGQEDGLYVGATIKVTTPSLNKLIGTDSTFAGVYGIALEHSQYDVGGGGFHRSIGNILLEDQTTDVSNTTYTRNVITYDANADVAILSVDSDMTERTFFSANSTGGAVSGECSTFEISFQVKDIDSVAITNTSVRNADAEVDEISRFNNIDGANTILSDTQLNTLLFPVPDRPLQLANNITYTFKDTKTLTTDSGGVVTFSLSGTDTFTDTGTPIASSIAEENFIVVVTDSGTDTANSIGYTPVTNGQYLSFSNTDGISRTINVTSTSAVIDCNTTAAIGISVAYTAKKNSLTGSGKTKAIVGGIVNTAFNYSNTSGANNIHTWAPKGQHFIDSPTRVVGAKIELPVTDVFNLVKVVDSGAIGTAVTNAMMVASANDITNSYSLDTGQTDNFYGHSSIILKPGKTPPAGEIGIVFDRFTHSGEGFFTVNSYSGQIGANINGRNSDNSRYDANSKIFTYSDIPKFTSPVSGQEFRLTDVLDFRPFVQENTHDGSSGTTFDVSTQTDAISNSSLLLPDSDTTTVLDYSYYVPRIDKLTLTRDREFKVIKGIPATNPVAPPDSEDSMTLYTLSVPAFTFALSDVETRYIDNKRFTMRDIGKLEKRIERLEYFTALNIVEKETAARDITSDGSKDSLFNAKGSRFKSGILVDSFSGHSVGDVALDDYNAAVHFKEKQLRPPFYYDNFRFTFDTSVSNNAVKTGDLVTLPYTNTAIVDQPLFYQKRSINGFNITNYIGALKLDPPSDTWFDETTRAEVTTNVEGHHDNWVLSPNGSRLGFGSQWNDWSVNWSGEQINPEPRAAVANAGSTVNNTRSTKLIEQNKSKFGIRADNPVETIVKTVGNRVVDMSVVPFVRQQRVSFSAKGLKPLTNVHVFIGTTNQSANTEPAKKIVLSSANGAFQEGEVVKDSANNQGVVRITSNTVSNVTTLFITNITGNSSANGTNPVTSQNNRISNSSIGFAAANVITGQTTGANGTIASIVANTRGILSGANSTMQTDNRGQIAGDIDVDAGIFRVGDRIVRITDQANNEIDSTTTVAEELFKAKGLFQSREKLLVSTRETLLRRDSLTTEDIVTVASSRESGVSNYLNPMAQHFFIDPNSFPMGAFVQSLDLFFSAKDSNLPVTVSIRPVINGLPSASQIIPFGEKTLNPDDITANTSSPTATNFKFDSPVYLSTGEYAFTVTTNSDRYSVWFAEVGQNVDGTSRKITPQPFVGKFFEPNNAKTWEPNPKIALMFKIRRCVFTGTGGVNNYAVFSSHANGATGNTANVLYQVFKTTTSTIEFSNTTLDYQFKSFDTSNTAQDFKSFSTDQNILLTSSRQMTSETNGMFLINASMSTSNDHISPVIDLDRMSLITIDNDVDNAGLAANDIIITTIGAGYTNTSAGAFTGTVSSPDLSTGSTATINVQVEVTMTVNTGKGTSALISSNSSYTVNATASGKFVVGEGIRIAGNTSGGEISQSVQANDASHGIITKQTFVDSNSSKNVASITIKTSSNNSGTFSNGIIIVSDGTAQDGSHTNSQVSVGSNTFMAVNVVTGIVSNVVPISSGSGYLTTPTITIEDSGVTQAIANVVGEDSSKGGNINARYVSRRVTLEDGFDATDLKVILSAYKPLGTDIHLYYKVKAESDTQDFDDKTYVLMSQETPSSIVSGTEDDIKEYVYKTADEKIEYTSNTVNYDTFKTFSVKVVMTSNNATIVPKVRDLRAIALD